MGRSEQDATRRAGIPGQVRVRRQESRRISAARRTGTVGANGGRAREEGLMDDRPYTKTELMICVAARLFQDGTTAFIGTGIPMLAAMLATKTVAPSLVP